MPGWPTCKGLKKLKLLDLRGCVQVSDAGLMEIQGADESRELEAPQSGPDRRRPGLSERAHPPDVAVVEDAQITDAGLEVLGKLTKLEDLSVFRCYNVSDDCFAAMKKLTHLTQLAVRDTPISAAGLAKLERRQGPEKARSGGNPGQR